MIPQGADTETVLSTLRHFVTFGGVILLYPPEAKRLLAEIERLRAAKEPCAWCGGRSDCARCREARP